MKGAFVIRDIDQELWREFKAACAHYDISIRATLIRHIQNIVNDYRIYKSGFTSMELTKPKGRKK